MKSILFFCLILSIQFTFIPDGFTEEIILNGKILAVNKEFDFVIMNLGEEDEVKTGMVFTVYRGNKFIGKIAVEEIYPEMSSCAVKTKWQQGKIKINDGVIED